MSNFSLSTVAANFTDSRGQISYLLLSLSHTCTAGSPDSCQAFPNKSSHSQFHTCCHADWLLPADTPGPPGGTHKRPASLLWSVACPDKTSESSARTVTGCTGLQNRPSQLAPATYCRLRPRDRISFVHCKNGSCHVLNEGEQKKKRKTRRTQAQLLVTTIPSFLPLQKKMSLLSSEKTQENGDITIS